MSYTIAIDSDPLDKIESIDQVIYVNPSGKVDIIETVTAGFYSGKPKGFGRSFWKNKTARNGESKAVKYKIYSVTRNGKNTEFWTKSQDSNWYIISGNNKTKLNKGVHQFVFRYEVDGLIEFDAGTDVLNWTIIDEGQGVDIENVSATIIVPQEDAFIEYKCNIPSKDSIGNTCKIEHSPHLNFRADLSYKEGFNFELDFKKGFFKDPASLQSIAPSKDNSLPKALILLGTVLGAIFLYLHNRKQ